MHPGRQISVAEKFKALQKVVAFVAYITDIHKLLDLIMEESKEILDAEASSLLLYDPKERVLFFEVAKGEKSAQVKRIKLKLGQGIAGACAKSKTIINVKDVNRDKRFFSHADKKSRFVTKSILAIPLVRKKKLFGVLEVLNKKGGGAFNDGDVELMKIIANQAALAIENAYLYRDNLKKARLSGVGQTMLSLSHDIKNILNGLIGGMTLLDEGMKESNKENADTGWQMVKRNVERISELILDMLNFAARKKPFLQKVKVPFFIRETGRVYEDKIREKGGRIDFELDERLPEATFDYQGLERVLLNLVGNAYEALPADGGVLTLGTKAIPEKERFQFFVKDNGCGIPPENLKKIFDVFFTTRGHKGTGLGLAVCKKIVSEHRGTIDVESEPGRGTTFRITLPLQTCNEAPSA